MTILYTVLFFLFAVRCALEQSASGSRRLPLPPPDLSRRKRKGKKERKTERERLKEKKEREKKKERKRARERYQVPWAGHAGRGIPGTSHAGRGMLGTSHGRRVMPKKKRQHEGGGTILMHSEFILPLTPTCTRTAQQYAARREQR